MKTSSVELLILDLLAQDSTHLSAQEVFNHLHIRLPAVNPSTVYRALERLAHEGKVSVSDMGDRAVVFEAVNQKQHHHLVCQSCKRVILIDDELVHPFLDAMGKHYDFHITTNHLILFGLCEQCRLTVTLL